MKDKRWRGTWILRCGFMEVKRTWNVSCNDRSGLHRATYLFPFVRLCSSDSKEPACNAGDLSLTPGSGRYPGKGNGYPLQCSCLKNSMVRGVCRATVHGVNVMLVSAVLQPVWQNSFVFFHYQKLFQKLSVFILHIMNLHHSRPDTCYKLSTSMSYITTGENKKIWNNMIHTNFRYCNQIVLSISPGHFLPLLFSFPRKWP